MITIDDKELQKVIGKLLHWANTFSVTDLESAAKQMANDYRAQIRTGKDGGAKPMAPISQRTRYMPYRFGDPDSPLRKDIRSGRKPFYATGRATDSIKATKKGKTYEVGPTTRHGNNVLGEKGIAFAGRAKIGAPKREPMKLTDRQMDMVENEILKSLDKALK